MSAILNRLAALKAVNFEKLAAEKAAEEAASKAARAAEKVAQAEKAAAEKAAQQAEARARVEAQAEIELERLAAEQVAFLRSIEEGVALHQTWMRAIEEAEQASSNLKKAEGDAAGLVLQMEKLEAKGDSASLKLGAVLQPKLDEHWSALASAAKAEEEAHAALEKAEKAFKAFWSQKKARAAFWANLATLKGEKGKSGKGLLGLLDPKAVEYKAHRRQLWEGFGPLVAAALDAGLPVDGIYEEAHREAGRYFPVYKAVEKTHSRNGGQASNGRMASMKEVLGDAIVQVQIEVGQKPLGAYTECPKGVKPAAWRRARERFLAAQKGHVKG